VRRLLRELKRRGDRSVSHALRGRPSNQKIDADTKREAVAILSRPVYLGFGPTLASEYLAKKHQIKASRETVRQWMVEAKLWRARKQRVEKIHEWRPRRSRFGELVQWDTSDHNWLEGRGDQMLLINMNDDATSRWFARFVPSDSTAENMNVLERYTKKHGRPLAVYTDKAALFKTSQKSKPGEPATARDAMELPPTQMVRALQELGIVWIAAHSPQAKGRVERGFGTAQDRLVKGMRVAGVTTLEQANHYLETEFLPWVNTTLAVAPASVDDAHRPLEKHHDLAAILSHVENRRVNNDYTILFETKIYQIARQDICAGLGNAVVRVERRRDGSVAVRFRDRYLSVDQCAQRTKVPVARVAKPTRSASPAGRNEWRRNFDLKKAPKIWQAAAGSAGRTRESQ
jgi:hypothetical protein